LKSVHCEVKVAVFSTMSALVDHLASKHKPQYVAYVVLF